jgi:uncharacterized protein (TIGR03546 family)
MLPFHLLSKLIKILRSAASPSQIAGGFILGFLLGMSPVFFNPFNILIVLLIFILNVNITSALFAFAIFSGFTYLLDPALHSLGYFLLVDLQVLRSLWTTFYNIPIFPYTRFNNTVVMGSLSVSFVLLVPIYYMVKNFIITYRQKYEPRVRNWKWVKYLKSTQVYQIYDRLKFLGD